MENEKVAKLAIDLTKKAPRSPGKKLGDYVILARAIDKCRATIMGKNWEYHFDCPLDNQLFGFKGIKGPDFKKFVAEGKSDEEILKWVDSNGMKKTKAEIKVWADKAESNIPEKSEWYIGACKAYGLNPEKTHLFQYLDADDKGSYKKR